MSTNGLQLWHWSCDHGHDGLQRDGVVKPLSLWNPEVAREVVRKNPHHGWLVRVCWLTDLETPHRAALGLTSRTISGDRRACRYRGTDPTPPLRWAVWQRRLPHEERALLNLSPGAMPMHWWVSEQPLPVIFDPL